MRRYPREQAVLEEQIENNMVNRLRKDCERAKNDRQRLLREAKRYGNDLDVYNDYMTRAENIDYKSCESYKEYRSKLPRNVWGF